LPPEYARTPMPSHALISPRVVFMTANEVARETGWAMHGWSDGDRATNEVFAPLETFGERFDALLARVRGLGFEAIDLWGAHLSPNWATDEHVLLAQEALGRYGIRVATYATWVGPDNIRRACELALAVGTSVIGGGYSGDPAELAPVLREHGVTLAIENHPELTPAEVLAKIAAGDGTMAATVDTGWWGTQGYDAALAIEELGEHVAHVHLKDVSRIGEPHETCAWGGGVVDVEGCVRTLARIGYSGALAVEHEPESYDPSEEIRAMREQLEGWLR
jgi:sugar phosphate isomerase/epimerase